MIIKIESPLLPTMTHTNVDPASVQFTPDGIAFQVKRGTRTETHTIKKHTGLSVRIFQQ